MASTIQTNGNRWIKEKGNEETNIFTGSHNGILGQVMENKSHPEG